MGLSAFCNGMMNLLPPLMGPKYAFDAIKSCVSPSGCDGTGYYLACLLSIVVAGLYEVKSDLEDPFDGDGLDDIKYSYVHEFDHFVVQQSQWTDFAVVVAPVVAAPEIQK